MLYVILSFLPSVRPFVLFYLLLPTITVSLSTPTQTLSFCLSVAAMELPGIYSRRIFVWRGNGFPIAHIYLMDPYGNLWGDFVSISVLCILYQGCPFNAWWRTSQSVPNPNHHHPLPCLPALAPFYSAAMDYYRVVTGAFVCGAGEKRL